ncbi:MAG: bacteriohemerythrin [Cyanobacteriota bacterium]
MSYIRWDSSLSIGIDIIDDQHKQIIDYINELESILGNEKFDKSFIANSDILKNKIKSVLDNLINYTVSHFAFEEDLLEKANYSFLDAHKKIHNSFIAKVTNYHERFIKGEDISSELLSALKMWLISHIKKEDKDYASSVSKDLNKKTGGWFSSAIRKFFG